MVETPPAAPTGKDFQSQPRLHAFGLPQPRFSITTQLIDHKVVGPPLRPTPKRRMSPITRSKCIYNMVVFTLFLHNFMLVFLRFKKLSCLKEWQCLHVKECSYVCYTNFSFGTLHFPVFDKALGDSCVRKEGVCAICATLFLLYMVAWLVGGV